MKKDKQGRYICKICKKPTLKGDLDRCDGMCHKCWDEQEVYQIFDNGRYKKLEMENLWDWFMEDQKRKLYGLLLCIYKNHKRIALVKLNGAWDDYPEFLETDIYPKHIRLILKILNKNRLKR